MKEPKKKPQKDFVKELMKIKGIGSETAKDIVDLYPTKEDLIAEINSGTHIPLRNDVCKKLIDKYGVKEDGRI